jgi:hypothetical protein
MNRVLCVRRRPPSHLTMLRRGFGATSACTHYPVFKEPAESRVASRNLLARPRRAIDVVWSIRRPPVPPLKTRSPLQRPRRLSVAVRLGEPSKVTSDSRPCQAPPGVIAVVRSELSLTEPSSRGQRQKIAEKPQQLPPGTPEVTPRSAGRAHRTNSKYHARSSSTSSQVSRTSTFCFCPFRTTSSRPSIACSRVTRACGSDTRRLLT